MTYAGGKNGSGVYQALINLIPPHETYIEPFLGGGAVLRLKRMAARSIGVDLDPRVVAWWSGHLSEAETQTLLRACRRGTPDWVRPPGLLAGNGGDVSGCTVIHGDGIQFLRDYQFTGGELVYCDPPYLLSTRVSGARYACEMTDAQHAELLAVLKRLPCRAMISGYSSVLYARELKTWHAFAFPAATRGSVAAEWVWCNFPRPLELHDYRYLGSDCREREKLKKQQRRWKARLAAMPVPQRQALLAAIAETTAEPA